MQTRHQLAYASAVSRREQRNACPRNGIKPSPRAPGRAHPGLAFLVPVTTAETILTPRSGNLLATWERLTRQRKCDRDGCPAPESAASLPDWARCAPAGVRQPCK